MPAGHVSYCFPPSQRKTIKQMTSVFSAPLVYLSQVFFFKKKLAENHHVREWALIKLVGAHDDFSAVYKHDIIHLISFNNSFSHRECHLTHSGI